MRKPHTYYQEITNEPIKVVLMRLFSLCQAQANQTDGLAAIKCLLFSPAVRVGPSHQVWQM